MSNTHTTSMNTVPYNCIAPVHTLISVSENFMYCASEYSHHCIQETLTFEWLDPWKCWNNCCTTSRWPGYHEMSVASTFPGRYLHHANTIKIGCAHLYGLSGITETGFVCRDLIIWSRSEKDSQSTAVGDLALSIAHCNTGKSVGCLLTNYLRNWINLKDAQS